MDFVVCDDSTYEKLYQQEHYNHVRLYDWHHLLGFFAKNKSSLMSVYFHVDDWEIIGINPELEHELEMLNDLKLIKLIKVFGDGDKETIEPVEVKVHDEEQLEFTIGE